MPAPAYVTIADVQVDPGKPATSALAYAFRDNLLAVTQGGSGAPGVLAEVALSAPAANVGQYLRVSTTVHPVDTPRKLIEYVAGGGTIYHAESTGGSVTTYTQTLTLPTTGIKKVTIRGRTAGNTQPFVIDLVLDAANTVVQAFVVNPGATFTLTTDYFTGLTSDTTVATGTGGQIITLKVTGTSIGLTMAQTAAAVSAIAIQAMVF